MRGVAISVLSVVAMVAPSTVSMAARPATADQIMAQWRVANNACQDNPDNTQNPPQCKQRDRIERRAEAMGWCWAYSDRQVPRADYHWHRCTEARPS